VKRLLAILLLAGCAPRIEVSDALSGAPLSATVRELDGGRILVEANGYETWIGPRSAQVSLHPLWQARFVGERVQADRPPPPPPQICCPGTRAR
jgi:hypothetical protein